MSAIDNKHLLEIIAIINQDYPPKGDRKGGTMYKAQCVFHGGEQGVQVGQLLLPQTMKDTTPGKYLAEFELGVNYKLEVVPRITALHVFKGNPAPAAAPVKAS